MSSLSMRPATLVLGKSSKPVFSRPTLRVRAEAQKSQIIQPLNGDPFVGMLETPVTSAPIVASYLSALPAYRTGVAPLLRGVEIGLAHGFLVTGPFIKLGPLRNVEGVAEVAGCLSGAGLVLILALCLSIYGSAQFQTTPAIGVKTLTGRSIIRDPLQSAEGWNGFTAGFTVGGLSGAAFSYILTQILPYYY
jgi:photosystem I subunit 11